jgi:hypothetical protein
MPSLSVAAKPINSPDCDQIHPAPGSVLQQPGTGRESPCAKV